MSFIKRMKYIYLMMSSMITVLGIYMFIEPDISSLLLCKSCGIILIVFGIVRIFCYFIDDQYDLAFQFDLLLGITSIIVGTLMIIRPNHILTILPIILGIFVLIDALSKIQTSIDAKQFGLKNWWIILLLAIINSIFAFILIFDPLKSSLFIMRIMGLMMMLDGIGNINLVTYTVKENYIKRRSDYE